MPREKEGLPIRPRGEIYYYGKETAGVESVSYNSNKEEVIRKEVEP